jgi:hypothetical protein
MRFLFSLLAGLFLTAFAAGVEKPPSKSPSPPPRISAAQQSEIARLLSEFRRARSDPLQREDLMQRAMQQGALAVVALSDLVRREMQPKLSGYSKKFYQRASALVRKKLSQADLAEVVRLRQTIFSLQEGDKLTKEAIVQQADPALRRLREIFIIPRQAVWERYPELQNNREKLQSLGSLWEHLNVYLYRQLPDDKHKPKHPPSFDRYLQGEEDLAVWLAAPMDDVTKAVLAANAQLAPVLDPEEARCILALNLTRNLLGLSALAVDLKLCAAARDHAHDMMTLKFFSHRSPVPGKTTHFDRAKNFGTTTSGENIYAGGTDGKAAHDAWWHSPGHHRNMLGKHKRVGVGRAGRHFTQMFGG